MSREDVDGNEREYVWACRGLWPSPIGTLTSGHKAEPADEFIRQPLMN